MKHTPDVLPTDAVAEYVNSESVLSAFGTVAEALDKLNEAELKRVVRAVLALNGLTHEDLEP